MTDEQTVRDANLAFLNEHGFRPAKWMPLPHRVGEASEETGFAGGTLRPATEIAERLCCHCAVFAWGSAPPEYENRIASFVAANRLRAAMTPAEAEILDVPKTEAKGMFANTVGWRLENMWSLAWILGLASEPSATTGQLPGEISGGLLDLFLPQFAATTDELLTKGELRSAGEFVRVEDLFYLAHNAVRSGQTGSLDCLPSGFHPVRDGGAIHERRHSLTWALSPMTEWDATDLST